MWVSYVCFFFFKQKTAYEMRISGWSSDVCSSDLVLGCDVEAVEVALGGLAEPGGRVGLLADQAGRGALGVVAGQHRLEDVGGGERPDQGRVDHRMREIGRAHV